MVTTAQMIMRLAFATAAGAIIGYERQMKGHPLGIRTNVLVCVSAATVMMLSKAMKMKERVVLDAPFALNLD